MKKEREDQPLDDLFVRKLGKLSLPPSADGFDRLRTRMAPTESVTKVVLWRNPAVQRYMAVAACLILVGLMGWLYWPAGSNPENSLVAVKQSVSLQKAPNGQKEQPNEDVIHQQQPVNSRSEEIRGEQVAQNAEGINTDIPSARVPQLRHSKNSGRNQSTKTLTDQVTPTVAQEYPVKSQGKSNEAATIALTTSPTPHPMESTVKPTPSAERVLVVTIEEPAVLVAVRRERNASDNKLVVALEENIAKESPSGNLWQKMKQLKQGELVARSENLTNDEQGLLSRAYTGLKHSIEKNKATKQ